MSLEIKILKPNEIQNIILEDEFPKKAIIHLGDALLLDIYVYDFMAIVKIMSGKTRLHKISFINNLPTTHLNHADVQLQNLFRPLIEVELGKSDEGLSAEIEFFNAITREWLASIELVFINQYLSFDK
jgi:hypothetical protein